MKYQSSIISLKAPKKRPLTFDCWGWGSFYSSSCFSVPKTVNLIDYVTITRGLGGWVETSRPTVPLFQRRSRGALVISCCCCCRTRQDIHDHGLEVVASEFHPLETPHTGCCPVGVVVGERHERLLACHLTGCSDAVCKRVQVRPSCRTGVGSERLSGNREIL